MDILKNISNIEFEYSSCCFCGSDRSELLIEGPDRLLGIPGRFRIVRCLDCGLLRQNPRPTRETIMFCYPPGYEPYSIAIDDEPSIIRKIDRRYGLIKRRRAVERLCSGGKLLDVGCATGNFLYEMARSGRWDVEGIEPNEYAAIYGRKRFGLKIHIGDLMTLDLPEKSYDVITMWDVFEHLHDPMENLKIIARLLKPGGWFIFSIPNLSSWERYIMGRYWIGWELPRHLYFPSQELMEKMLSSVGLYVIDWKCLSGAYISFLFSLRFAIKDILKDNFYADALIYVAKSVVARAILSPVFWVITYLKKASIITGFAQLKTEY